MDGVSSYKIIHQLYSSEKISIFRGIRLSDNTPIILKRLNAKIPTQEDIAQLKYEYTLLKQMNLPSVIRAYGLEEHENQYELILEDIPESTTLSELIARETISISRFLSLAIKIAQGLHELHSVHIIHKDINPHNILITRDDSVKLIDFSIATQLSEEIVEGKNPEGLEGTLPYISPEQTSRMNRVIDERTDLYSTGVTFYEILTGRLPFEAEDAMEWVHSHIAKQAEPPHKIKNEIPEIISDIIMKLLSKAAENRYASAYGLKMDLENCLRLWNNNRKINTFPLGEKDRISTFHIPQKLYGREKEVRILLDAFEKAASGSREFLLVSGSPGIGKSTLVNEVQKPIVQRRGYFCGGKFEQFQRFPYGALIQALRKIIQQILSENKKQIEYWRKKIIKTLKPNAQIIIDVIPELEWLIGKQEPAPQLNFADTHNQFELVFLDFIRIFAQDEHPLTLYIDDLQWADLASINLIHQLLRDRGLKYFLLIGAYRDNEVNSDHPLLEIINELTQTGMNIANLKLEALNLQNIIALICDTLNISINYAETLGKLIHEKTGGNPFFVKAFLLDLYRNKQIKFDLETNEWLWDIGYLRSLSVTENVVDLIMSRINQLPEQTQQILKIAACVGNQFDLETLSFVFNIPQSEIAKILWVALQENLIVPLDESYRLAMVDSEYINQREKIFYKFSHDRVQQAVYTMMSSVELKETDLNLARLLLDKNKGDDFKNNIFKITNHYNASCDLLTDPNEKHTVAKLNFQSGKKAKYAAAYSTAANYFKFGLDVMGEHGWEKDYNLMFDLSLEYGESQYLLAQFDKADQLFKSLIDKTKIPLQKAQIILTQLLLYEMQCNYDKTVELGLAGLNILGFKVARNPSKAKVAYALFKLYWQIRKKTFDELLYMPAVQDPEKKLIFDFIQNMAVSTYLKDPNLFAFLAFTSFTYATRYGITASAVIIYSTYAVTLIVGFKNYNLAYQYGQLALKLLKRFNDDRVRGIISQDVTMLLSVWKTPYKDCLDFITEGYQICRQGGELVYANISACVIPLMMLLKGDNLQAIDQKIKSAMDFVEFCNNAEVILNFGTWTKMITVLLGNQEQSYLQEHFFNYLNDKLPFKENTGLGVIGIVCMTAAYILKDWNMALKLASKTKAYAESPDMQALFCVSEYYFYAGLTFSTVYSYSSFWQRRKYKKEIYTSLKKFKLWSELCPDNFQGKYLLLRLAFSVYIDNDMDAAYQYYEHAIGIALKYDQINLVAIGNELLAHAYLLRHQPRIAKGFLQEALFAYKRWGAEGKVKSLQKEFPELSDQLSDRPKEIFNVSTSKSLKSAMHLLDLTSVVKSAQAISSRVKLDDLLRTLIKIMIENAGAERGVILLLRNQQLLVEAEGRASQSEASILKAQPIEERSDISLSVIQYVQNTFESVVLDDAAHVGEFTDDSYIAKHKALSILCMPILQQGKLLGILYLENNLATGIFTAERLEVLGLLASQTAISLENALLYTAYNQFVPHEFLDLLERRSIVDIGLGDHVQKYMTIMFADIRDFTKLSEKMTAHEVFIFINEFLGHMEPLIKQNKGFIDKYMGDAIMALFPEHPSDAVLAGNAMQEELAKYNQKRIEEGHAPIRIGIGINSGSLMLGTLGSKDRLEPSVLSDAVNVASRLEELTKEYGSSMLIGEDIYHHLNSEQQKFCRFVEKIYIRGKEEETAIWENFLGDPKEQCKIKLELASTYEEAIDLFYKQKYKEALKRFQFCQNQLPADKVINSYIKKCLNLLKENSY